MEMGNGIVFLIIVYCAPGSLNNFIEGLIENMKDIGRSNMRIVLVRDFNLDKILETNVTKINQLNCLTTL